VWLHWPVMIDDLTELRTSRNVLSTFGHLKEQFTQKSFTHRHLASNLHDLLWRKTNVKVQHVDTAQ